MTTPIPAGCKLMPIEPTTEILKALRYAVEPDSAADSEDAAREVWAAMLAAAPTPPAATQDAPITVSLDPDPRGVSVGVYQGTRCLHSGAHPIPAGGWLDIASAPKDSFIFDGLHHYGTKIIVFDGSINTARWWRIEGDSASNFIDEGGRAIYPTHWQPLPAAPGSPASTVATEGEKDDETQAILRWIMRAAESAKEDCGMDPETPAAIRNGKLASIASAAAQALGLTGGPSYRSPAAGDALDWYERRRELEPGMIFRTAHGVVKLERGVPGDGTKWYVLDWNGDGWSAYDDTVEPGDLIGAPVADHPIAIELARTAALAAQVPHKGDAA